MKNARHSNNGHAATIAALPAVAEFLHRNKLDVLEARVLSATSAEPVSIATVVKALRSPFSTISRVAWELSERDLLTYERHPTDRRKKLLRSNLERLK